MAHVNRKEYWVIFAWLAVLTVAEVAVAYLKEEIGQVPVVIALCSLAVTKAALVFLFYMHMKHETRILKSLVAIPLATPVIYAFILVAEVAWRLSHGAAGHLQ